MCRASGPLNPARVRRARMSSRGRKVPRGRSPRGVARGRVTIRGTTWGWARARARKRRGGGREGGGGRGGGGGGGGDDRGHDVGVGQGQGAEAAGDVPELAGPVGV